MAVAEEASLFSFGMKSYDTESTTPEYSFPKYSESKMPVNQDSAIITETHFKPKGVRTSQRHAWAWGHKKFQLLHRSFANAMKKMDKPFKNNKCVKGQNSEIQLLNSCLYNHLLVLSDATHLAIDCIEVDKHGKISKNHFKGHEKSQCWAGGVHNLAKDLAGCCHAKLESKKHCEVDAKPMYLLEKTVSTQFDKCSGWRLEGHTKESPGTWKLEKKPDLKACHHVAQKLMYLSLDVKDWYMFNSHKSGGMASQCMEDADDDWVNSGDQST